MKVLKIASVVGTACITILFLIVVAKQVFTADTLAPQISMESTNISVSVTDGDDALLAGTTATDAEDGDITDKVMVETISNFISEWEREITVVVFDSDDYFTKTTRTITYTDYTPTQFALSSPLRFTQGVSSSSFLNNLSAEDCLDGDVSATITQYTEDGSTIDTEVPGEYQITFSVSNSAGAVSKFTATVEIYDPTEESVAPKITLTDALVYLEKGASFDPMDYLVGITYETDYYEQTQDGSLLTTKDQKLLAEDEDAEVTPFDLEQLYITNPVDTAQAGWYEVVYRVTDSSQNTKTVRLIVCVTE